MFVCLFLNKIMDILRGVFFLVSFEFLRLKCSSSPFLEGKQTFTEQIHLSNTSRLIGKKGIEIFCLDEVNGISCEGSSKKKGTQECVNPVERNSV